MSDLQSEAVPGALKRSHSYAGYMPYCFEVLCQKTVAAASDIECQTSMSMPLRPGPCGSMAPIPSEACGLNPGAVLDGWPLSLIDLVRQQELKDLAALEKSLTEPPQHLPPMMPGVCVTSIPQQPQLAPTVVTMDHAMPWDSSATSVSSSTSQRSAKAARSRDDYTFWTPTPKPQVSERYEKQANSRPHAQTSEKPVTTVMIQNLPRHLTQSCLINELNNCGFEGSFDFAYMPQSFHSKENSGFAFVNFIDPCTTGALVGLWHRQRRFGQSMKQPALSIAPAEVQGLEANLLKWETPRLRRIRNVNLRPFVLDDRTRTLKSLTT